MSWLNNLFVAQTLIQKQKAINQLVKLVKAKINNTIKDGMPNDHAIRNCLIEEIQSALNKVTPLSPEFLDKLIYNTVRVTLHYADQEKKDMLMTVSRVLSYELAYRKIILQNPKTFAESVEKPKIIIAEIENQIREEAYKNKCLEILNPIQQILAKAQEMGTNKLEIAKEHFSPFIENRVTLTNLLGHGTRPRNDTIVGLLSHINETIRFITLGKSFAMQYIEEIQQNFTLIKNQIKNQILESNETLFREFYTSLFATLNFKEAKNNSHKTANILKNFTMFLESAKNSMKKSDAYRNITSLPVKKIHSPKN
jgi:hypothetical protein